MKNFDSRVSNISDFVEWHERGQLNLTPDFQRRSVWSPAAKSYLVDTVIRGKPMPKILLTQEMRDRRNIRIVIDGQQRLRAILEFYQGAFAISRAHNKEFAANRFENLPLDAQDDFMKYEISYDLLYDMPLPDILDIFARLNTYGTRLNPQEQLNAQYVGFFKQSAFRLGHRYVGYLLDSGVVTKASISRMSEAELSSDLLAALVDGVQTNKSLNTIYKKYDQVLDVDKYEAEFDHTMSVLGTIYSAADLGSTNWSRAHFFYSLFTCIAHCLYGLKALEAVPRVMIAAHTVPSLRISLDEISLLYDRYTSLGPQAVELPPDVAKFIEFSRRGTTDTRARIGRAAFICSRLANRS